MNDCNNELGRFGQVERHNHLNGHSEDKPVWVCVRLYLPKSLTQEIAQKIFSQVTQEYQLKKGTKLLVLDEGWVVEYTMGSGLPCVQHLSHTAETTLAQGMASVALIE